MNSRQRYRAKRMGKFNESQRERKQFAQRINRAFTKLSEGCSDRVKKAVSPIDLTDLAEYHEQIERNAEKMERKNRRIWYRDTNPLGNKIHAVQKQRGKSIPAYYD